MEEAKYTNRQKFNDVDLDPSYSNYDLKKRDEKVEESVSGIVLKFKCLNNLMRDISFDFALAS